MTTILERNITDSGRDGDDRPLPTHSKPQTLTCWNIGISSIMIKRAWKRCKKHYFSIWKIWRTWTSWSECHNQSPSHSGGWTPWRARQYTGQDLDWGLSARRSKVDSIRVSSQSTPRRSIWWSLQWTTHWFRCQELRLSGRWNSARDRCETSWKSCRSIDSAGRKQEVDDFESARVCSRQSLRRVWDTEH